MVLELKNINKNFGGKNVLNDISFKAHSGASFGLLGRNGAGKTTTIRILMNVFPADSGDVLIDGQNIDYNKIKLGYLPEERGLYPKKKVLEQLLYFANLNGLNKADALKSIDYWLERLEMTEYKNKRLDTLSKGNQQKIQLITALVHDPDLIVLDEPFSGLDPVNAMLLKDVVKEEINKGKIVLFSSHQMNYIEEFCDSIAIIKDGKIAITGNINKIKKNYKRDKLIIESENYQDILKDYPENTEKIKKNIIMFHLDKVEDKQKIMKKLVSTYDIDEIEVFEPSLNDIFVEYTK